MNAGSGIEALILPRELGEDKNPSEDSYTIYYFNIPNEVSLSNAEVVLLSDQGNTIVSREIKGEKEDIVGAKKRLSES